MIAIENNTIHITRGDVTTGEFNRLAVIFPIYNSATGKEEKYKFKLDDKITFTSVKKKGYTQKPILQKEYTPRQLGYTEETEVIEIPLTEEDTKKFPLLNKKATYWYEISLNNNTTILGHDENGGKQIIVYPEADD